MFPECSCLSEYETNIATLQYLGYLLTEFDQTCDINGLCIKDECFKFWGQKVIGQGHCEVKYAPKCTFWLCHILA